MNSLRIATWNLDYLSLEGNKADLCHAIMADIQAKVWILTETQKGFNPGEDFCMVAESDQASDLPPNRRWTTIWAHRSLSGTQVKTLDSERTACARFKLPGELILHVYGTVLPWLGSTWKGFHGTEGKAFLAALAEQMKDWHALQSESSDASLCVAGDFNQDLLETGHYYGSKVGRKALTNALEQAKLKCLTSGKMDPVARLQPGAANIDHICISGLLSQTVKSEEVIAWSPKQQGSKLSDHFGVSVEVFYP